MILSLLILFIYGIFISAVGIGIIYLIYKRISDRDKETFERRDN